MNKKAYASVWSSWRFSVKNYRLLYVMTAFLIFCEMTRTRRKGTRKVKPVLLTYSLAQGTVLRVDGSLVVKKFPIVWDPTKYYCARKMPPLDRILNQMKIAQILQCHLFTHFSDVLPVIRVIWQKILLKWNVERKSAGICTRLVQVRMGSGAFRISLIR
jgi:hypothetical protein